MADQPEPAAAPAAPSVEQSSQQQSNSNNDDAQFKPEPAANGGVAGQTGETSSATSHAPDNLAQQVDERFRKIAVKPAQSPSTSSLTQSLSRHRTPAQSPTRAGGRNSSRPSSRHGSRNPSPTGQHTRSSAATHSTASGMHTASPLAVSNPPSGTATPADLTMEEQLARLKSKVEDLSSQVTSLNGKLVASYNRFGNLEDERDAKVMETRQLSAKIEKLEADRKVWEDKYEGGLLVEKDHVQSELSRMMDRVIEETASRGKAESDKATIERELAELSSQLFQEANTMVAIERRERLRAERKMEDLDRSFHDTESLMASQSEQMRDLGGKIDQLETEREELKKRVEELESDAAESAMNASTISLRSDASAATQYNQQQLASSYASSTGFAGMDTSSIAGSLPNTTPLFLQLPLPGSAPAPTTPGALRERGIVFAHPIQFMAFDVPAFQEFVLYTKSMMRLRKSIITRPVYGGEQSFAGYGGYPAPYTAGSMAGHNPSYTYLSEEDRRAALKEALQPSQYTTSPFIKRILEEDSDPSLRLDSAPGLGLFSRRQISTAIIDGQLAIEPAYTSLPSKECSLCGTSLEKYIASHQSTQPKDDPRKKLTRLATGWIPTSISGAATPTRESQERGNKEWSISTLTDALGALTPSREIAGFNFGGGSSEREKANAGHYTPYRPSASSRPSTSSGIPNSRLSFGSASGDARKVSMPPLDRKASMRSDTTDGNGNGGKEPIPQGDFLLTQSAKQQGQIYLFRALDSSTRYTLCPHNCLPRLRAVCEIWTYVRNIHRGLLQEEFPKIYPSPFATGSEYTKLVRKITGTMHASQQLHNMISGLQTPAPGVSRQLGDAPLSSSAPTQTGMPITRMNSTLRQSLDYSPADTPPIMTTTNSVPGLQALGLGLGLNVADERLTLDNKDAQSSSSGNPSSANSTSATAEREMSTAPTSVADSESALSVSSDDEGQLKNKDFAKQAEAGQSNGGEQKNSTKEGEVIGSNEKASLNSSRPPAMPARPPRSGARGGSTPASSPMVANASTDSVKANPVAKIIESRKGGDETPTQRSPAQPSRLTQSPLPGHTETFKAPPPPLPPRSPNPNNANGAQGVGQTPSSPKSPRRGPPGRLSIPGASLSFTPAVPAEAGPMSAGGTTSSASTAATSGPVSTRQQDWQQNCWFELVRLKEGAFWARVGANYNKEA